MQNLWKIVKISKPLHFIIGIISTLIVFTALLELVSPFISKFIVDEIVLQVQKGEGSLERLLTLVAIAFLANMVGTFTSSITERLGDHFTGRLRKFLTEKFYDKVLTLPQSYYDSKLSGKIVNQLNRGIISIQEFMNSSTNFILPMFLQSIFTIVVLAYYSILVAGFVFILFPIYFVLSYYSAKKWGREEIKKNKIEDINRGRIQEVIYNIPLVKSFNNEYEEFKTVAKNLSNINSIYAHQSRIFHIFDFLRNTSLNIILLLVNIVVFISAFKGALTIGEMVLIIQLVTQARRPLFAMSFILSRVQTAESGSKEYIEVLEVPSQERYKKTHEIKRLKNPTIEFKNVSFKYDKSDKILDGVTFSINRNETVALVGHSGAGKSTIVNLILKFYSPTTGEIFLSGKPYKNLEHTFVRDNISLVFQENELFSSTIKENVSYGTKATDEQVVKALKLANAFNFVLKLPKGIESEVGERGLRLSGGQKQRIQIARAILKNAPILILDEATSSLDSKSEKEVQDALETLMKNKLVIVIAHRFSTIQHVDTVIVIDNGKISEYGKPQDLSSKKGLYSELLHYQVEGNKKLLEKFELY